MHVFVSHVMQTFQDFSLTFYIQLTLKFHHLLFVIIVSMGVDPALLKETNSRSSARFFPHFSIGLDITPKVVYLTQMRKVK